MALSVPERLKKIEEKGICKACLSPNQLNHKCFQRKCNECNGNHATLLHMDANTPNTASTNLHTAIQSFGLLATAVVKIRDSTGKTIEARALLDSGAQPNFITRKLATQLKLKRNTDKISISGFGNMSETCTQFVQSEIASRYNDKSFHVSLYVTEKVTNYKPNIHVTLENADAPNEVLNELADPSIGPHNKIDLLLGIDDFFDIIAPAPVIILKNGLKGQKTTFGYCIVGKPLPHEQKHTVCNNLVIEETDFNKFWEIEEINNSRPLIGDEVICMELFTKTTKREVDGKFIVSLPWKMNQQLLGDSFHTAERRYRSLERKLESNIQLKDEYIKFMDDYVAKGHMKEVTITALDKPHYYLPHHAVIKQESKTTKVRVVFDGSAKTTTGLSLNDILHTGPLLQDDLFEILIRFRNWEYALAADLSQMYRQVWLDEMDKPFHRILWRDAISKQVKTYELQTVTYGTGPAAFLATRCLHEIAVKEQNNEIATIIKRDFYVDDLLTGAETLHKLSELKGSLTKVMKNYGFELHKWCSNITNLAPDIEQNVINWSDSNKVLGIAWDAARDSLKYKAVDLLPTKLTKRFVLSNAQKIFDPLGLISPITIRAKLIMQQLWQAKLSWDEEIPEELKQIWKIFAYEIKEMEEFQIPRYTQFTNHKTSLVIFCDASERAYGAVIYARTVNNEKVICKLMCAKSKVCPLKKISLPRLELCAALLASQLYSKITKAIKQELNAHFYTDSTITLAWIKSNSNRWKTFIANRVSEIQSLTNKDLWFHVESNSNPADLLSRGVSANILLTSNLWWNGPAWILNDLPTSEGVILECVPEAKINNKVVAVPEINFMEQFSNYSKLLRVISYCMRFIKLCKKIKCANGPITTEEISVAERTLVKIVQRNYIHKNDKTNELNINKKFLNLNPFLDNEGIVRVGGRLKKSSISFSAKFPILLPHQEHLTKLIARSEHERCMHGGIQLTIAHIRQKFWPTSARRLVKNIVSKCISCAKANPKALQPLMADLPPCRINKARPFMNVGIDFCGPFELKSGFTRNCKVIKAYISVFVCMATKAVHFELVSSLQTNGFLAALRRFMARRGISSNIYSDNGTNFVGAERELKKLLEQSIQQRETTEISSEMSKQRITWHFIPPRAPHFGGLWEAVVKSLKYHIKRVSLPLLNYEQFYTFACQIEAILNSRPLTCLSDDPNDLSYLTPSHFLVGDSLTSFLEPSLQEIPIGLMDKWQAIQAAKEEFWKRWQIEYLQELQKRAKWTRSIPNLQIGQLVIVKEDNVPPGQWKMGRIISTFPGSDGIIRAADVLTSTGTYKRPVVKLCPLPVQSEIT